MKTTLPLMKNCVLAVQINQNESNNEYEIGTEKIIIGELENVRNHLLGKSGDKSLIIRKRPIGSLIIDCFELLPDVAEEVKARATEYIYPSTSYRDYLPPDPSTIKKSYELKNSIENLLLGMFNSKKENVFIKFYVLRMWQEINNEYELEYQKLINEPATMLKNNEIHKNAVSVLSNSVYTIDFPFRKSIGDYIIEAQKECPSNPLSCINEVFYKFNRTMIDLKDSEYVIAEETILPVIRYYLEKLYSKHRYFQVCKVCGKIFLAKTANIPTLCSVECKREQNKLNKRKFDKNKKNLLYEKSYSNAYMIWYNSYKKLRDLPNIEPQKLRTFNEAFIEFRIQANAKKQEVKDGVMSESEFNGWLANQTDIVYKLKLDIYER